MVQFLINAQVSDFLNKFGIVTVAVNEDTPNCPILWSVRAFLNFPVSACLNIEAGDF